MVSTVGRYRSPYKKEYVEIGCNRYYETMAFHASLDLGLYWDADVSREVSFESRWSIPGPMTDRSDQDANDMHEAVVTEITGRLESGDTFEVAR